MKRLLHILLLITSLSLTGQNYQFGIVSDYNNTDNPYEFTFVATPDFTNADPNMADIQITLAITSGNAIQASSFTEILGSGWQVNTALTGSILQNNFGIGDGTKDLWIFSLPVPTSELTTSHNAGVAIPIFSFIVDNAPTSGEIEILENNDPIALALAGFGFVVDNVINADLNDGNGTQDYYGNTDPINNDFIFSSLSINEIEDNDVKIVIHPNPIKDYLNIEASFPIDSVVIYDAIGKKVLETKQSQNILLSHLNSGVYILKIYSENSSVSKQIIKQ
ncbi:T9SS type A sorting domain-containing protein [Winogradskyella sp. 3972H.M.0a.05]|uniref:T9SS type A sorting domain-containing protein n=1 Tax=Winogradskyella sp. 3972H.M.0a.05 TaxID=2950277 RepID=UPI003394E6A8